jgi:hypothetical protein
MAERTIKEMYPRFPTDKIEGPVQSYPRDIFHFPPKEV